MKALISTFHADNVGDGIDEQVFNILHEVEPEIWIAAMLQDLPRLSTDARETCDCLIEFAIRTPEVLIALAAKESKPTQSLLESLMDKMASTDLQRGIESEIPKTLENLRAALTH